MISDHGVRTLYENTLRNGYNLEKDGKYQSAMARYNDALEIAKSFEDEACIKQCNAIIFDLDEKIKENENSLNF